jgi:predicted nucleic acid-binding Zn ribbon protein
MDADDAERTWNNADRPAEELVPRVLARLRLDEKLEQAQVLRLWTSIIDPVVAAHTRPLNFANGTLFVAVDSNVWLDEIVRYRRHEILERLQHALGRTVVQRVSYRVA